MGLLKNIAKSVLPDEVGDLVDSIDDSIGKVKDAVEGVSKENVTKTAAAGLGAIAGAVGLGKLIKKDKEDETSEAEKTDSVDADESSDENPDKSADGKQNHKEPNLPPIRESKFQIYAMLNGKQEGPYNEIQFARLLQYGLADGDTDVWSEGMTTWEKASQVKMLRKFFPPALPSSVVPLVPPTQE